MIGAKVKTGIVAVMAIVAVFAATLVPMGEPDATVSYASSQTTTGLGEFNIYFMIDSQVSIAGTETASISELSGVQSGWVGFKGDGSDGYIATMDVLNDLGFTSASYSFDSDYILEVHDAVFGDYITNNTNYGAFTELLDLSASGNNGWYVYVYSEVEEDWVLTTTAIGLYQPYSDWIADLNTANIAFYYGGSEISAFPDTIMPITIVPSASVDNNAAEYAVSFTFVYPGQTSYGNYVYYTNLTQTAVGYGSNAWSALKNALGSEVTGGDSYSNIGWINSLKGISSDRIHGEDTPNDYSDDVYKYWNLYYYDDSSVTAPGFAYSNFTTGFYSPLDGSAQQCDNFLFVYA